MVSQQLGEMIMQRIAVLFVSLVTLLLPGLVSGQVRVRVGAPPTATPEIIQTAAECNAYNAYVPKRQRCLSCVAMGRRFFRQGDAPLSGYCEAPPAPPPPASLEHLRTPGECATYIVQPPKRARCFDCIRRAGTFHKQGEYGFGACVLPAAPPPPPPPTVDALRTPGECDVYVALPAKRVRCHDCVRQGGTFFKQGEHGYGHCSLPAPPPPPPPPAALEYLTTPGHCAAYCANPAKRHRCMDCVRRGGTFTRQGEYGFGQCSIAAAPPPPPPPPPAAIELVTVGQCFDRIAHPGTRNHCRKCIERGGRWDLRGFCTGAYHGHGHKKWR